MEAIAKVFLAVLLMKLCTPDLVIEAAAEVRRTML
jgi:hypothetical protein